MTSTSPTLIVAADHILDGSGRTHDISAAVVSEGRVVDLLPGAEAARRYPEAEREHFEGASIIPGLIDLHGYLSIEPDRPDPMRQMFGTNHFDRAWVSARHMRRDLHAGITTVRVMGEGHGLDFAARDAVRAGLLEGPDLITSGVPIAPTNSHQSDRVGCDGVEAVRHAVRANLRAGADCIKLVLTGGVNAAGDSARALLYSEAEIATAVEEAARANTYVAAAAHGGPAIAVAMRLGVRMIEHGALLDEDGLEQIQKYGGYLVATPARFFHPDGIEKSATLTPAILQRLMNARAAQDAVMPKAISASVNIALGSDNMHGMLHYDMACLVRWGANPLQALHAATGKAAEAARLEDRGLLAAGRRADLVVVRGDATRKISAIANVVRVMKEGRWLK
jgi:imidazolonepropionase-like amidohydrolase